MFPDELITDLEAARLVAVVVIESPDDAQPLARALYEGGVRAVEVALRTPAAIESAQRIVNERLPGFRVGLGTVITPDQVTKAQGVGADFAVAPGLNPEVVAAARRVGLPFAPGVATPSEIEHAAALGCNVLKLFPATALGGSDYLRAIAAPYSHLGLRYVPLGGVDADSASEFLRAPGVLCVGGSWLTGLDLVRARDFGAIRANAASAVRRLAGTEA